MSRRRAPKGLCVKIPYRTELEAKAALDSTQGAAARGHDKRGECRFYRCPICRKFHLTSKESR
jgi:hypothetical protein